jgi:hypothetical protein
MTRGDRVTRTAVAPLVVLLALTMVSGCSKKTTDAASKAAKSALNDAKNAAGTATAVVAANAFRADVKVRSEKNKKSARATNLLRAAEHDLTSTVSGATVTGITDQNKDHRDDDGKVQIELAKKFACVTISADGTDTTVTQGKC